MLPAAPLNASGVFFDTASESESCTLLKLLSIFLTFSFESLLGMPLDTAPMAAIAASAWSLLGSSLKFWITLVAEVTLELQDLIELGTAVTDGELLPRGGAVVAWPPCSGLGVVWVVAW